VSSSYEVVQHVSSSIGIVLSAKYFSASSRRKCFPKVVLKPTPKNAEFFSRKLQP